MSKKSNCNNIGKKSNKNKENDAKKRNINLTNYHMDNIPLSAITINRLYGKSLDLDTVIKNISELTISVIDKNDNRKIQGALLTQAKTLGVLFNTMVMKAMELNHLDTFKVYMDVALRAQNQARKTLIALDAIQHPHRQTVINQQNNALNQQVNNGLPLQSKSKIKPENELLEVNHGERLDFGTTTTAIPNDTSMETVEISRCKNTKRKRTFKNERS